MASFLGLAQERPHWLQQVFEKRFVFLFLALLLPYLTHPLVGTEVQGIIILDVAFSLVLFMGVFALSDRHHFAVGAFILVLLTQALTWSSWAVSDRALILLGILCNIVYLIYTATVLLRHIVTSRAPTFHTIFASLCIYLLMGYVWAFVYSLLEDINPGSFHFNSQLFTDPQMSGRHLYSYLYYFIYFSFTTQTTLGFGDILPASPWARMFTSMEAVLGQLYLVVIVTYLIGLHINSRTQKVNESGSDSKSSR